MLTLAAYNDPAMEGRVAESLVLPILMTILVCFFGAVLIASGLTYYNEKAETNTK